MEITYTTNSKKSEILELLKKLDNIEGINKIEIINDDIWLRTNNNDDTIIISDDKAIDLLGHIEYIQNQISHYEFEIKILKLINDKLEQK